MSNKFYKIIFFFIFIIMFSYIYGTPGPTPPINPVDLSTTKEMSDVLFQYMEFLKAEAERHKEFLEFCYTITVAGIGAFGVVLGGILTFLNWRTKEKIREEVGKNFQKTVNILIDEELKKIDSQIVNANKKIKEIDSLFKNSEKLFIDKIKEINSIVLKLTQEDRVRGLLERGDVDFDILNGKMVLWVCDPLIRDTYPIQILKESGVIFVEKNSIKEALEFLEKRKIDLVISTMNIESNHQAGIKLLNEIKAKQIEVSIIFYCDVDSMKKYRETVMSNGADAIVSDSVVLLNTAQSILFDQV